jgi:hypothetical protein
MELLHDDFESADQNMTKSWRPGLLYQGKAGFSIERRQFWKSRFGEFCETADVTDECKEVVERVVNLMESLRVHCDSENLLFVSNVIISISC